jgi:hypothetical protein
MLAMIEGSATSWRSGRWLCHGIVLTIAIVAGRDLAEAADPEGLIREGIELRRRGEDAEALRLFQQAFETHKSPKACAQIGLAEQALGKWGAAERHLHQAILSADDPWIRKNRVPIDEALKVIAGHVGRLDVRGSPAGAEVRVDGELIGQLPIEAAFSATAGGVGIEVRAPDHLTVVRAATVKVGELVRETFDLQSLSPTVDRGRNPASGPSSSATSTVAPQGGSQGSFERSSGTGGPAVTPLDGEGDSSPVSRDRSAEDPGSSASIRPMVALAIGGLAAVALTFGIVEHITWQHEVSSFGSTTGCDSTLERRGAMGCQQLYDDGKRAKALAFVGYGLTVGLAATAAIVYISAPALAAEPNRVACAVNPFTPGLGCALRF